MNQAHTDRPFVSFFFLRKFWLWRMSLHRASGLVRIQIGPLVWFHGTVAARLAFHDYMAKKVIKEWRTQERGMNRDIEMATTWRPRTTTRAPKRARRRS